MCNIREIENATQRGYKSRRHLAASDTNTAVWLYVKCTLLFFTALLVTWIPTTLNRLIALVNGSNIASLEILTAIVLPLQGFFNAVIYAYTSREEFKGLWRDNRTRLPSREADEIWNSTRGGSLYMVHLHAQVHGKSDREAETESTRRLAQ